MGCSTKIFRVATGDGSESNTIGPPPRNISVLAYPVHDFGKLRPCPYLDDESIEYPRGDSRGQAGWDITIPYENITNLADILDRGVTMKGETKRRFGPRYSDPIRPGEVARLGIMAHGDQDGQWFVNGKDGHPVGSGKEYYFPLMANPHAQAESVEAAAAVLRRIGRYMKSFGSTIVLVGCMAGQGRGGTALLMALSAIWPRTFIAAFDVVGYRHSSAMTEEGNRGDGEYAGMKLTWYRSELECASEPEAKLLAKWNQMEWASEYSKEHAKIVLNQEVVQWPSEEAALQNLRGKTPSSPPRAKPASTSTSIGPARTNKAQPPQYPPSWSRPPAKSGR
jgi:hypothetical protein